MGIHLSGDLRVVLPGRQLLGLPQAFGLGTIFILVMMTAVVLLWRNKLFDARWMLWHCDRERGSRSPA